jgi:hypothetical protein
MNNEMYTTQQHPKTNNPTITQRGSPETAILGTPTEMDYMDPMIFLFSIHVLINVYIFLFFYQHFFLGALSGAVLSTLTHHNFTVDKTLKDRIMTTLSQLTYDLQQDHYPPASYIPVKPPLHNPSKPQPMNLIDINIPKPAKYRSREEFPRTTNYSTNKRQNGPNKYKNIEHY